MTPLRKSINKNTPDRTYPKGCGRPTFSSYGFVFSDNIQKWIASGKVSSVEYKKAKPVF